jgi:hypothetical protein
VQQQRVTISRRQVLTSLSVIEDASLGACDARVLSVHTRSPTRHPPPLHPPKMHTRCHIDCQDPRLRRQRFCSLLNRFSQQFYSQEDLPAPSSAPQHLVVEQTQFDAADEQEQLVALQSQYMSMTQASMSSSQRERVEKELQDVEDLLRKLGDRPPPPPPPPPPQQQQQQQQQQAEEDDNATDDDEPMITTSSPCQLSPDMAAAPCPSPPPPSRLDDIIAHAGASVSRSRPNKTAAAAKSTSAKIPAPSARCNAAARVISKTTKAPLAAKATNNKGARSPVASAVVATGSKSSAAKLADASRGSSRRRWEFVLQLRDGKAGRLFVLLRV